MSLHPMVADALPDTTDLDLDLAGLFRPAFPSAQMVQVAGALLAGYRLPERELLVGENRKLSPSDEKSLELWGQDPRILPFRVTGRGVGRDHALCEGPRTRITVAPGVLQVSRHDPVRADRTAERRTEERRKSADQEALRILAGTDGSAPPGVSRITSWSAKSRSNMVRTLAQLDYAPLFAQQGIPAMLTLTYPGEWEGLVPTAKHAQRHMRAFCERYRRAYGHRLVGVWKREFQRRGAPHFHVLLVPPTRLVQGLTFRNWVARNWTDIVGPEGDERDRMLAAHSHAKVVDYAEGMRAGDPKRLAIYFGKHGAYRAKDYQNDAPRLWLESGVGVGRFWGVWGLDKALCTVEVTPAEGLAATRTMRRHARANGYTAQRDVWRAITTVDVETGEIVPFRWRRRRVTRRVRRMRGDAGFVTLNDAPAFVSQLSRYLDQVRF